MRINTNPEQLAKAFASLKNNESFQEINAILELGGKPHDMVKTMAMYPPLLEAMESLGNAVYPGGSLHRELKELIILQSGSGQLFHHLNGSFECEWAIFRRGGSNPDVKRIVHAAGTGFL